MERVELSPGLMALYLAIRAQKTPGRIERELGLHRQTQANQRAKLVALGVIVRRGDIHPSAPYTVVYPWQPTNVIPVLPRYPKGATFRDVYPVERKGVEVTPIAVVRWWDWSVQGVPVPRPDGRPVKSAAPEDRIVRVTNLDTGVTRGLFEVALGQRWTERLTTAHVTGPLTPVESRELTVIIAAVIGDHGVEAVLELDNPRESQ